MVAIAQERSLWRAFVTWMVAPVSFLTAFLVACGPDPTPPDVLANQVRAAIHADVRVAPYEVEVEVDEKGRVVLRGEVDRAAVKQIAEDRAREVDGVHTLLNRIEVRSRDERDE